MVLASCDGVGVMDFGKSGYQKFLTDTFFVPPAYPRAATLLAKNLRFVLAWKPDAVRSSSSGHGLIMFAYLGAAWGASRLPYINIIMSACTSVFNDSRFCRFFSRL